MGGSSALSLLLVLTVITVVRTQTQYFDILQGLQQLFQPYQGNDFLTLNNPTRAPQKQTNRQETRKKTNHHQTTERRTKKPSPTDRYDYVFATTEKPSRKTTKSSQNNNSRIVSNKSEQSNVLSEYYNPYEVTTKANRVKATTENYYNVQANKVTTQNVFGSNFNARPVTENVFGRETFANNNARPNNNFANQNRPSVDRNWNDNGGINNQYPTQKPMSNRNEDLNTDYNPGLNFGSNNGRGSSNVNVNNGRGASNFNGNGRETLGFDANNDKRTTSLNTSNNNRGVTNLNTNNNRGTSNFNTNNNRGTTSLATNNNNNRGTTNLNTNNNNRGISNVNTSNNNRGTSFNTNNNRPTSNFNTNNNRPTSNFNTNDRTPISSINNNRPSNPNRGNTNNRAISNFNNNWGSTNNFNQGNVNPSSFYYPDNPLINRPGVQPAPVDIDLPPITNRPVTNNNFFGNNRPSNPGSVNFGQPDRPSKPSVNFGQPDREPEILIGPDEDDMTELQKRRYEDTAERMCDYYKSLTTKKVVALPLIPSPDPVEVNVSDCTPINVPLIIGGSIATIQEFPHMALVGWTKVRNAGYSWKCGGSLISDRYILSAGHCTFQDKDANVVSGPPSAVQLGSSYLDDPGALVVKVAAVIRHPKYKQRRSYHDIALIKMVTKVRFSEVIRPACLGFPPPEGRSIIATGWGRTEFGGDHSFQLRSVSLSVWNMAECREIWGTSLKLPSGVTSDSHMCAGERSGGKDTCQGDSGGPAQIQDGCLWRVVAVTSYGRSCAAPDTPALYAVIPHAFVAAQVFSEGA